MLLAYNIYKTHKEMVREKERGRGRNRDRATMYIYSSVSMSSIRIGPIAIPHPKIKPAAEMLR